MSSGGMASNDEQRPMPPNSGGKNLNSNAQNFPVDNTDSSNGGLIFADNTDTVNMSKEDMVRLMNLPNGDLSLDDIEKIPTKPKMPVSKRKISRHQVMKNVAHE